MSNVQIVDPQNTLSETLVDHLKEVIEGFYMYTQPICINILDSEGDNIYHDELHEAMREVFGLQLDDAFFHFHNASSPEKSKDVCIAVIALSNENAKENQKKVFECHSFIKEKGILLILETPDVYKVYDIE
jgi:hypothetical protein